MLEKYIKWIVNHPWKSIFLSVSIVTGLSIGSAFLTFRSDSRVFFSDKNPELQALDSFEAKYGRDDTLVFIFTAKEGDLFTPEKLAAINDLTDQAWHLPHVKRVDSVTNFQRVSAVGDDVQIDHLARSGDSLTPADARKLKDAAMQEPLLLNRMLSQDARVGLVAIQFRLNDKMVGDFPKELTNIGREMANRFAQKYPMLEIRISGSLPLDNAFSEAGQQDGMLLTPTMFGLIFGVVGIIFRSVAVVTATFLVIGGAIGAAMGTAGLIGIPLSSPSVATPFMILTLATADCIHLAATTFQVARDNPGQTRLQSVMQGVRLTFRPITLTSVMSAIGFFSLLSSESPPFSHMGLIAGFGVLYAWGLSVTLFPALLLLIPWKTRAEALLIPDAVWQALHAFIKRRSSVIISVFLVLGGALSLLAFTNVLEDRFVHYFDDSFDFRRDTDYLNAHLGFYTLEYSLDAGMPEGVVQPDYLKQVDAFSHWMRQQNGVAHVTALSDMMQTINRGMNGGGHEAYRLPDSASQAAQYLSLYEMSLSSGMSLREVMTVNRAASRMTVSLKVMSTQEVLALSARAKSWVDTNAPLLRGSANATGLSVLFSHIGQRNIEQMLFGTFTGFLMSSAILFFIFRSVRLGSIAFVANTVPQLVVLGGWALVVGEVGMAVSTIVAVTLGIIVDDTIHFIEAVREARKEGVASDEAVLRAFQHTGQGLMITTLTLVIGFSCLAFSHFQINAWMGLMTAIVIVVAVIFDLLFLPSVLIKLKEDLK